MTVLSASPIDPAAVLAEVGDPEHGGSALFVGTTRREAAAREIVALEYEAYEELALSEIQAIREEAGRRHGARVAIAHRLGRVEVGEPTVVVGASAVGRDGAFAATRYAIDELKRRVPIWKRAHFADGGTEWLGGA